MSDSFVPYASLLCFGIALNSNYMLFIIFQGDKHKTRKPILCRKYVLQKVFLINPSIHRWPNFKTTISTQIFCFGNIFGYKNYGIFPLFNSIFKLCTTERFFGRLSWDSKTGTQKLGLQNHQNSLRRVIRMVAD